MPSYIYTKKDKKEGYCKNTYFTAKCLFTTYNYKFILSNENEISTTFLVSQIGTLKHSTNEIHRRQITGDLRMHCYEVNNAYREYMESWADEAKLKEIRAGNLTRIPNTGTLRQIKHQKKLFSQLDKDPFTELCLLQEGVHNNYICLLSKLPFSMVCQKSEAMKILLAMMKSDSFLTISFDATGGVVRKFKKDQKQIYYHVGVIQTEFGPLPLTEYFTDDQTTESLQTWLNKFKRSFSDLTKKRIFRVQSDYCWAQLLALSKSINDMHLKFYLEKVWLFFYNGEKEFQHTIIYICAAHVAHSISKKLKTIT